MGYSVKRALDRSGREILLLMDGQRVVAGVTRSYGTWLKNVAPSELLDSDQRLLVDWVALHQQEEHAS